MNAVGNVLYALLILAGLGGGGVFVTAITVVIRGRRSRGPGQERLRLAQAAVHERHRDHRIMREAVDEVDREDAKALVRRFRAGATQ